MVLGRHKRTDSQTGTAVEARRTGLSISHVPCSCHRRGVGGGSDGTRLSGHIIHRARITMPVTYGSAATKARGEAAHPAEAARHQHDGGTKAAVCSIISLRTCLLEGLRGLSLAAVLTPYSDLPGIKNISSWQSGDQGI